MKHYQAGRGDNTYCTVTLDTMVLLFSFADVPAYNKGRGRNFSINQSGAFSDRFPLFHVSAGRAFRLSCMVVPLTAATAATTYSVTAGRITNCADTHEGIAASMITHSSSLSMVDDTTSSLFQQVRRIASVVVPVPSKRKQMSSKGEEEDEDVIITTTTTTTTTTSVVKQQPPAKKKSKGTTNKTVQKKQKQGKVEVDTWIQCDACDTWVVVNAIPFELHEEEEEWFCRECVVSNNGARVEQLVNNEVPRDIYDTSETVDATAEQVIAAALSTIKQAQQSNDMDQERTLHSVFA